MPTIRYGNLNQGKVSKLQAAEWSSYVNVSSASSLFPSISVNSTEYRAAGSPVTRTDVFDRHAVLAYIVNTEEIQVSLSAGAISLDTTDLENEIIGVQTRVNTTNTNLDTANTQLLSISGSLVTLVSNNRSGSTTALSATPATISPVTLLAADTRRIAFIITNNASTDLHVRFGPGATAALHTVTISVSGYYETPKFYYSGIVTGVWKGPSPTGQALMTEIT